jgi:hypothetical protein
MELRYPPLRQSHPAGGISANRPAAGTLTGTTVVLIWGAFNTILAGQLPPRPGAALPALGVAMAWTGLVISPRAAYLTVAPLVAALIFELYPRWGSWTGPGRAAPPFGPP